jgi:hypothetical protein
MPAHANPAPVAPPAASAKLRLETATSAATSVSWTWTPSTGCCCVLKTSRLPIITSHAKRHVTDCAEVSGSDIPRRVRSRIARAERSRALLGVVRCGHLDWRDTRNAVNRERLLERSLAPVRSKMWPRRIRWPRMLLLDDTAAHATLLFLLTRTACCHHTIIACTRRSFTTLTVMGRTDSCELLLGKAFPENRSIHDGLVDSEPGLKKRRNLTGTIWSAIGPCRGTGDSMHDFHRLRFSTAGSRRLQGTLVPPSSPFGLLVESPCIQNSSSVSMLMPITRGIATASPVPGAGFRIDYAAPATGSLQFANFGPFVSIHQLPALLAGLICLAPALGKHFLLRRTLKPVHFESI